MVYPNAENTCAAFGENDMTSPQPWEQAAAIKGDGNYRLDHVAALQGLYSRSWCVYKQY